MKEFRLATAITVTLSLLLMFGIRVFEAISGVSSYERAAIGVACVIYASEKAHRSLRARRRQGKL